MGINLLAALDHDCGEWLKVEARYGDACPLHSRVERAEHAELAELAGGGWRAEETLYVQMRQISEEGHARRCTQEDYLTLKSCRPT